MKRFTNILFIFLVLATAITAQKFETGSLQLSGVSAEITFPDNIPAKKLYLLDDAGDTVSVCKVEKVREGIYSILINETGNYKLSSENYTADVRIIPGYLSIIPPLAAILLALLFRQVVISLLSGIYIGALFIYDYNPLLAFLRSADDVILKSAADEGHVYILLFTLLIGGVVGIISANGGTRGLALQIIKVAKNARSGMIASWLLGLAIFFDDLANTLIMGNMLRPITDKLRISREKLAYIVDSTSAPIASLMIISTWIGYELGLIDSGLKSIGYEASAYTLFIDTIPLRFYPIAALFMVFVTSFLERDFGPMYKTETDARKNGIAVKDEEFEIISDGNEKWYNGAVPILLILFGTVAGLFYTGITSLQQQGISGYGIQDIIGNSDSYKSLLWSSVFAGIVAIGMTVWQKILTMNDAVEAWQKGIQSMVFACIILVFAWGISLITTELKTADYIISVVSDSFDPHFLSAVIFIICAAISFSTGTSWGTMAIVMPIVIPLAYTMAIQNNVADPYFIITGAVSSVLAGAVFGDHCSPIADTTILSSMSSGCNHIDHVRTQLPYSLTAGAVALIAGELPVAFGVNPYIAVVLILTSVYFIVRFAGKPVK